MNNLISPFNQLPFEIKTIISKTTCLSCLLFLKLKALMRIGINLSLEKGEQDRTKKMKMRPSKLSYKRKIKQKDQRGIQLQSNPWKNKKTILIIALFRKNKIMIKIRMIFRKMKSTLRMKLKKNLIIISILFLLIPYMSLSSSAEQLCTQELTDILTWGFS